MRDRAGADAEILMLQRAATMAFAGGAWVFPGGRIEPGDIAHGLALAAETGEDAEDLAARIGGIRETIEEAGFAVGLTPVPSVAALAAIRAGLAAGKLFADLLAEGGFSLALDALVPFARWTPPPGAPRRFDTRFYIARAPSEGEVEADGGESVAICWAAAADMLGRVERGEAAMIFPTRANLTRIGQYACYADAAAAITAIPMPQVEARRELRDGVPYILVPEGIGYPPISEKLDTEMRAWNPNAPGRPAPSEPVAS